TSSEDELAAETDKGMRMGKPTGSTARGMFDGSDNESAVSKSSEEEVKVTKVNVVRQSRKRRRETPPDESEDEYAEPTVKVIPRNKHRRIVEIGTDSEDDEPRKKRDSKRRKMRETTPEETGIQPASRKSRRRSMKAPTPDESSSLPSSSLKRRRSPSEDEDEDDRDNSLQPTRRRSKKVSPLDEEDTGDFGEGEDDPELVELREDLAFLRSSPLPDRGRLRSVHDKPKNKRQEALEALKRRRAGTSEVSSSATPGRRRAVVVETDSESELEIIKEEPGSDLEILEQDEDDDDVQEPDRDANALDMFLEDQDDEQFIDDEVDNTLGEPAANEDLDEMRLAFSLSRAKTKDLFRNAVEWMVMKKLHPGFDATKHVYTLTFRKLDDEVKGLAGSKYTSSAWTVDFTRALRARPDFLLHDLSPAEKAIISPHCDACNRTNHTASFELMLTGQPYNPETLEPVASDTDSESDSSSGLSSDSETGLNGEKQAYNFAKERIPPETYRFPLGSTCKANAQVAHTLYHWKYHLYQWVKDYLKAEGHLTAEKLVKRDGWSDRKREKKARKVVDYMEETGQIRSLYNSYKNQLQAALETDNDYRNGWGRGR
ncbi:repeatdomain containing protein, partial [Pyrenophora tritici-repentis]